MDANRASSALTISKLTGNKPPRAMLKLGSNIPQHSRPLQISLQSRPMVTLNYRDRFTGKFFNIQANMTLSGGRSALPTDPPTSPTSHQQTKSSADT